MKRTIPDVHSRAQLAAILRLRHQDHSTADAISVAIQLSIHGLSDMATMYVQKVCEGRNNARLSALFEPVLEISKSLAKYQIEAALKKDSTLFNHLLSSENTFLNSSKSKHLIIVFATGWNNFGISLPVLHAMLKNYQASILYIKNCTRGMYCDGSPGIGGNIDEIARNLKFFGVKNSYEYVSVLGFSSGGYAALLTAIELGAQTFVGLGIRTDWSEDCKIQSSPGRARPGLEHRKTNTLINLAHSANVGSIGSAVLFFGEHDTSDRLHALNMRTHKNFQIIEVSKSTHNIVISMVADGEFEKILRNFLYQSPKKIALKTIENGSAPRKDITARQIAGSTEVNPMPHSKPRLLVIDDRVPVPSLGAGYPRAAKMLQEMADDGWSTTLFTNVVHWHLCKNPYEVISKSINLAPSDLASLESFLGTHVGHFDVVLVSRPHNMKSFLNAIAKVPGWELVPVLYDAEAIFTERDAALARLRGLKDFNYQNAVAAELELALGAHTVFSVSKAEARTFCAGGCSDVRVLGHSLQLRPLGKGPENRQDMLFVGALDDDHSPNADSLVWFVHAIMPLIDKEIGKNWRLHVAGRAAAQSVRALASERVRILGEIEDLDPLYASARLLIAPTRFAAGIPLKVHEAASVGLPVVATDILARQLDWTHRQELMSAACADDFSAGCIELYRDEILWSRLRLSGLGAIQRDCSPEAFSKTIRNALRESLSRNPHLTDRVSSKSESTSSEEPYPESVAIDFREDRSISPFRLYGLGLPEGHPPPVSGVLALPSLKDDDLGGPGPLHAQPPTATGALAAQDCARDWLRLGRDRLAASQTAEAHTAFSMALNCAPELPETHSLLAITWLLLGAPHLAVHHAQIALAVVPDNADALLALAGAARRINNFDLTEHATRALSRTPGLALLHDLLRISDAIDAEDYEVALYQLAEIHEADPHNAQCKELFIKGFKKFMDCGRRYLEFIDGLGLSFALEEEPADISRTCPDATSIDIVIPVHNALDDLSTCLASVERWWSPAIGQIILVDDASDSETAAWLDRYAAAHPFVRLIRQPTNGGFTTSIVAGLAASGAAFALLLNSDTIVTPGWIDHLWRALTRRLTTALAGPMSNNAYMQTVTEDLASPELRDMPQSARALDPEIAAAVTRLNSRGVCPRVPLLSGFCLMLRRDAYDLAGGLDAESFPQGYWEIQDLCLRLIDLGYDAVLADDSYVHHKGSQSIGSDRRSKLLHHGLRKMHARHSALRLLAAEMISRCEPEIAHHRRGWFDFGQRRLTVHESSASPEPRVSEGGTRRPLRVARELWFDPVGQEVCLFVTHAPLGQISEYTRHYMAALMVEGVRVIACHVVNNLDIVPSATLLDAADATVLRLDGGYDFAAWADVLAAYPQIWQADRLYFVNDSLIGPFSGLGTILDKIRRRNAGFFALSECTNTRYHAQSFFFGWNRANLQSGTLRDFWNAVVVERDKSRVVLEYEYRIAPLSPDLPDVSQNIVFGMETALGAWPSLISCVNPTHHAWRRLLEIGFPFVKTDLLRDGVVNIDTDGWEAVCANHGADLDSIHRHIERSRVQRTHFGSHLKWETFFTCGEPA